MEHVLYIAEIIDWYYNNKIKNMFQGRFKLMNSDIQILSQADQTTVWVKFKVSLPLYLNSESKERKQKVTTVVLMLYKTKNYRKLYKWIPLQYKDILKLQWPLFAGLESGW